MDRLLIFTTVRGVKSDLYFHLHPLVAAWVEYFENTYWPFEVLFCEFPVRVRRPFSIWLVIFLIMRCYLACLLLCLMVSIGWKSF